MKPRWLPAAAVVVGFGIAGPAILAKPPSTPTPHMDAPRARGDEPTRLRFTAAPADTFVLGDYRWGAPPGDPQGWTGVDLSIPTDTAFHVDDFAGMDGSWYTPISGAKSLWCGTRTVPDYPQCASYPCLPGYLNDWEQVFESVAFPRTGDVTVSFRARWDSEPDFDATRLEYMDENGWWTEALLLDGRGDLPLTTVIPGADLPATVKLRLYFSSDNVWSDEDCLYPTDGAVIIDDLTVRDANGVLDFQDFESEPAGAHATSDGDWSARTVPPFGDRARLYPGVSALQEDPCTKAASAIWTFFVGSTYNYSCGGNPNQKAIPYGTADGVYIWNELWSPLIDWNEDMDGGAIPATADGALLEFDVYRDMPLDALLFYVWHVRAFDADGCPGPWQDRNFVYYGGQKDWFRAVFEFGDLIPPGTEQVQIAIGVRDMCASWCGAIGENCHTHAPMFGNVRVRRVAVNGPSWSIRDIDQFQDNFAELTGPAAGKARADMAQSITPSASLSIVPGDSAVVRVSDPQAGLALDAGNQRAAVYGYVSVSPVQASKTGAHLVDDARYPVAGSWTDASGAGWTVIQCDSVYVDNVPAPNSFCVDLNDALFEPGDVVRFFYAARNVNGVESYAHGSNLGRTTLDREAAAADPAEFSVLPYSGGDILYVDGMDGRGSQPYVDTAFQSLGILAQIDRYDVRGPTSQVSNLPAGRVKDVSQLLGAYRKIVWDAGDLDPGLGNGTGWPKTNDWQLAHDFLDGLTDPGGMYIAGDDVGHRMHTMTGSAVTFRTKWLASTLTSVNARQSGYGVNPVGVSQGGVFTSDASFVIGGGCPLLNDFDVLAPQGSAVNQITYGAGAPASTNGAVLSQATTNAQGQSVGLLFGGFSFAYIIDDDTDGVSDRAAFLHDALIWLGNAVGSPTPVALRNASRLDQNHPNPFNPATTIAFSLRARARAVLVVYNVAGERVRVLADEVLAAGPHERAWDGRNDAGEPVASGVYFYRLTASDFASTKKMVLLR